MYKVGKKEDLERERYKEEEKEQGVGGRVKG